MTKKKIPIKLGPNYSALCDAVEKHDHKAAKWMREVGAKMDCEQELVWEADPDNLGDAFTWADTPHGFHFWNNLDNLVGCDRKSAKPAAPTKPLDPLEKMVRERIMEEDKEAFALFINPREDSRESRIAARLAHVQASIRGELPILTMPDPLAGVPEADSGEALVGRWCVVRVRESEKWGYVVRIDKFTPSKKFPYIDHMGDAYAYASPWERGIPEVIRKAVDG